MPNPDGVLSMMLPLPCLTVVCTHYDQDVGVEVFEGCSSSGQESKLTRCRNNHSVGVGHLLVHFHAHSAKSCQVGGAFISANQHAERAEHVNKDRKFCRTFLKIQL